MNDNKVISVYISTNDSESAQCKKLQNLFSSDIFDVNVIQFDQNNHVSKEINDLNQLKWAINDSDKDKKVLFIKDDCELNVTDTSVETVIKNLEKTNWDVCSLSMQPELVEKSILVNDFSALILNEKGKEKIINYDNKETKNYMKYLVDNQVQTTVFYPNLFKSNNSTIESESQEHFDTLSHLAKIPTINDETMKEILDSMYQQKTNNSLKLILFLLIVIILFFVVYWYTKKNKISTLEMS
jgi:hypothetical protein